MRTTVPWLLALAFLPQVENPWPNTIGVEFPIATAAAGSVVAGVAYSLATREKRERAIKIGGLSGFCVGGALYFVSLLVQVVSNL